MAGAGCMETCNGETVTDNCASDAGTTSDISLTLTSTGASGTISLTGPGLEGGVIDCSYTVTITKQ
jgi:hypothetical protein